MNVAAGVAHSETLRALAPQPQARAANASARVALLGTGTVGGAVIAPLAGWRGGALDGRVSLVHVANSRCAAIADAIAPEQAVAALAESTRASSLDDVASALQVARM